mmetsp:Transcript_24352/g.55557  ORF Transcript_24352/g.55557 Transcript_24352/m.55557 type:complete len:164 (-) Transcript_24352:3645-4136(-)
MGSRSCSTSGTCESRVATIASSSLLRDGCRSGRGLIRYVFAPTVHLHGSFLHTAVLHTIESARVYVTPLTHGNWAALRCVRLPSLCEETDVRRENMCGVDMCMACIEFVLNIYKLGYICRQVSLLTCTKYIAVIVVLQTDSRRRSFHRMHSPSRILGQEDYNA